jgi:cytochrome c nitrite reductase small subunit
MNPETGRKVGAIIFGAVVGLGLGVGAYTLLYAKGWAYLTNDPAACANCHVMQGHLDAWIKSSHRAVATCNDCHTPHNFFGKYYVKADHGFWHSYAFTTGNFHEPIHMTARSQQVTEGACRNCHEEIVHAIETIQSNGGQLSCIRCHGSVGHPM